MTIIALLEIGSAFLFFFHYANFVKKMYVKIGKCLVFILFFFLSF